MGIAGWLEDCVWVLAAFFYRGALITIFYDDSFALSECTALPYRDQHSFDTEKSDR